MHPTIFAQRSAIAQNKLAAQAEQLAHLHGAEMALEEYLAEIQTTLSYDLEIQELLEREARVKLNDAILASAQPQSASAEQDEKPAPKRESGLHDIPGIGDSTATRLNEAGFHTKDDVRKATDRQLLKVEGIGQNALHKLREATKKS